MNMVRMTSLFPILTLTATCLFADHTTPFCDTPVGSIATGTAYLVTLPGCNKLEYGICAQPDYVGSKHLYLVSIPPGIEVRELIGKPCKITAKAVAFKQGDKQYKRFEVKTIERGNLGDGKDKTIVFLGTVASLDNTFSTVTVRVDKKVEGDFQEKTFTIHIPELAASGLEVEKQYNIEALLDAAQQFVPYRWTKQQTPEKPSGGDGKTAPQP